MPQPPALPEPVAIDCADGWSAVSEPEESDVQARWCRPWADGAPTCEGTYIHRPGRPECEPFGQHCPTTGDFPDVDDRPALFVRPGGTGDGTREQPFGDLSAALATAQPGTVVVLAKGELEGPFVVPEGVELRGTCASDTVLTAPAGADAPVARLAGRGAKLRDVRVAARAAGHPALEAVAEAAVERVVVDASPGVGLRVARGELEATDVLVLGSNDAGVIVEDEGAITATGLFVRGATAYGLLARHGAQVRLSASHIDGIRLRADDTLGIGLAFFDGTTAQVERTVVQRSFRSGVETRGAGTNVSLDRVHVTDTRSEPGSSPPGSFGYGLLADRGSSVTVNGSVFMRNRRSGVRADGGAMLDATDLVVLDSLPQEGNGAGGIGLTYNGDSRGQLRRGLLRGNHRAGLRVDRSTFDAEDLTVRDTKPTLLSNEGGWGLHFEGAAAHIRRALVERNTEAGIFTFRPDAVLTFEDITVRDTLPRPDVDVGGRGLHAAFGPQIVVERALFENNRESSIGLYGRLTSVELKDTRIDNTASRASDGRFGAGVTVSGAMLEARRLVVQRSHQVGVWAGSEGIVRFHHVAIEDTMVERCASTGACQDEVGMGLGAYQRASLFADHFRVKNTPVCGIQLAAEGNMRLQRGTVQQALIGACLQVRGFDINRLTDGVRYEHNQRNIDSVELPIPEAAMALPGG